MKKLIYILALGFAVSTIQVTAATIDTSVAVECEKCGDKNKACAKADGKAKACCAKKAEGKSCAAKTEAEKKKCHSKTASKEDAEKSL